MLKYICIYFIYETTLASVLFVSKTFKILSTHVRFYTELKPLIMQFSLVNLEVTFISVLKIKYNNIFMSFY